MRFFVLGLLFLLSAPGGALTLDVESATNRWSGEMELIDLPPAKKILEIRTEGQGHPSFIRWDLSEPADFERQYLQTYLQIDGLENWFGIEIRLSDTEDFSSYFGIALPRFSDPEFNIIQPGVWRRMTFTMGEAVKVGTPDIRAIKYVGIYVEDRALGQGLTLRVSDLALRSARRNAILSMTFDDGARTQRRAVEVLSRAGLRGTAYIMPRKIDAPEFLLKEDLIEMSQWAGWSLSSHFSTPMTLMSPQQMEEEIDFAMNYILGLGQTSGLHLAYPLGKVDQKVLSIVRAHYRSARMADGGAETLPPADWHLLRGVNVTPEVTPEVLRERIRQAQRHGEWLVLMFHHIVEGEPTSLLEYNSEQLEKLVQVINETDISVLPVDEVWESFQVD